MPQAKTAASARNTSCSYFNGSQPVCQGGCVLKEALVLLCHLLMSGVRRADSVEAMMVLIRSGKGVAAVPMQPETDAFEFDLPS